MTIKYKSKKKIKIPNNRSAIGKGKKNMTGSLLQADLFVYDNSIHHLQREKKEKRKKNTSPNEG